MVLLRNLRSLKSVRKAGELAQESMSNVAYRGLTLRQSQKVRDIIEKGILSGKSLTAIVNEIVSAVGITRQQANAIVRTEAHAFRMSMIEMSYRYYDITGEQYLYRWLGPKDKRTSPQCLEISRRTQHGVSLNELKRIVEEVARKYNPFWHGPEWTPHPNCRHTISRVFR